MEREKKVDKVFGGLGYKKRASDRLACGKSSQRRGETGGRSGEQGGKEQGEKGEEGRGRKERKVGRKESRS